MKNKIEITQTFRVSRTIVTEVDGENAEAITAEFDVGERDAPAYDDPRWTEIRDLQDEHVRVLPSSIELSEKANISAKGYYLASDEETIIAEALHLWAEKNQVTDPIGAEKAMTLHHALLNDTWLLQTTWSPEDRDRH